MAILASKERDALISSGAKYVGLRIWKPVPQETADLAMRILRDHRNPLREIYIEYDRFHPDEPNLLIMRLFERIHELHISRLVIRMKDGRYLEHLEKAVARFPMGQNEYAVEWRHSAPFEGITPDILYRMFACFNKMNISKLTLYKLTMDMIWVTELHNKAPDLLGRLRVFELDDCGWQDKDFAHAIPKILGLGSIQRFTIKKLLEGYSGGRHTLDAVAKASSHLEVLRVQGLHLSTNRDILSVGRLIRASPRLKILEIDTRPPNEIPDTRYPHVYRYVWKAVRQTPYLESITFPVFGEYALEDVEEFFRVNRDHHSLRKAELHRYYGDDWRTVMALCRRKQKEWMRMRILTYLCAAFCIPRIRAMCSEPVMCPDLWRRVAECLY